MGLKLVFLGPPGVGKGTQAERAAASYDLLHLSTGDMLRDAVAQQTEVGKQAETYMDKGELVPDDVVIDIVRERLRQPDAAKGYILDGFPRTLAQGEALDRLLDEFGIALDRVLYFTAPDETLVERIVERSRQAQAAGKPARADDNPETVRTRLEAYRELTEPLVGYYRERNLLTEIMGTGTIEIVAETVTNTLNRLRARA